MPLVRTSPLPPGFYWVDLMTDRSLAGFGTWVTPRVQQGKVAVLDQQPYDFNPQAANMSRNAKWVKFQVLHPVEWPAKTLGIYPDAATADTTHEDTFSAPDVPDGLTMAGQAFSRFVAKVEATAVEVHSTVKALTIIALIGAGLAVYSTVRDITKGV